MSWDLDCVSLHVDLPEEGAQIGLYALMAGISEECWCAGWMSGLEFDMWDAIERGGKRYGQSCVTERQARLLRDLADECDGWWVRTDDHEPAFIRLDEWRKRLAALKAAAVERRESGMEGPQSGSIRKVSAEESQE